MDEDERKLIRAASNGDLEECKRILREKNVNINARDPEKHTALFLAAKERHLGVVSWLLENGADVRVKSASDQTPLHAVCWSKQTNDPRMIEVAKLLIEHGQDVNVLNRTGHSPLHWASYYGHVGLVRLLLEKGADATIRNADGQTPLDKARLRGTTAEWRAVISLLEESGGLPVASFYGYLFEKKKLDQKRWHEGLVMAIDNVHDAKIFYTILKSSLTLKMISKREAAVCLQKAIVQTAKKVTSQESVATYEMFLTKCRADEIVKDDPSFLLLDMTHPDHFPADIKPYIESVVTLSAQGTQDLDMGTNFHDMRQNLQILCDEMFTLHQYSANDEDDQAFLVVQALDGNYMFRMKAQAMIIMVMILIKAMERGVDESMLSLYSDVTSRIVDFGDLEHMNDIISKVSNDRSSSPGGMRVLTFKESIRRGVDIAKNLILETRNGMRRPEDFDELLFEPDVFLIFGFISTIMHPASYPPQKKENSRLHDPSLQDSSHNGKKSSSTKHPSRTRSSRKGSRSRSANSKSPICFAWRSSEKRRQSPTRNANSPGWSSWRPSFPRARSRSRSRSMDVGQKRTDYQKNGDQEKDSPMRFPRNGTNEQDVEQEDSKPTPDNRKPAPGMVVTPPLRDIPGDGETPYDESPRLGTSATSKTLSMSSPSGAGDKRLRGPLNANIPAAAAPVPAELEDERGRSPARPGFRGRRERSFSLRRVSRSASPTENEKMPAQTDDRDFTPLSSNLKTPSSINIRSKQNSDLVVIPREELSQGDSQSAAKSAGSSTRGRSRSRRSNGSRSDVCSKTTESNQTAISASRISGRLIKVYRDAELTEQDESNLELHAAVKFGDVELLEELLGSEKLTDVQLNALDSSGRTALDFAALTGQIEAMTMIESRGGIHSYRPRDKMLKKAKKRAPFVSQYLKLVGADL